MEIATKIALYTLRRDERSKIRGKEIMRDYLDECEMFVDPLVPNDKGREVMQRTKVYAERYSKIHLNKGSTETLRCLAYSLRYADWNGSQGTKEWWDGYNLKEAQGHIRTRKLIEILIQGKWTGNRMVVFCHQVFLLELTAKV
jgi:hypothetical protein